MAVLGVKLAELEMLVGRAMPREDVSSQTESTPETRHIIDARRIGLMKP